MPFDARRHCASATLPALMLLCCLCRFIFFMICYTLLAMSFLITPELLFSLLMLFLSPLPPCGYASLFHAMLRRHLCAIVFLMPLFITLCYTPLDAISPMLIMLRCR